MTLRRKKSREKGGCSTLTDWPGSCSDSLPHPKCTCYQDRVNHRPGESTITHTRTFSLSAFNASLRTTKQGSMSAFFVVSGGKNCPQSIQARALSLRSLCISLTKHNSQQLKIKIEPAFIRLGQSAREVWKQAAVAFSVISASIVSKQQHFLNL